MRYLVHHFKMLKHYLFLLMLLLQMLQKMRQVLRGNKRYVISRGTIEKYNVLIDERNFYDQPINDLIKQYEVRKYQ